MGVMMQAFYWDCPEIEGAEYAWWEHVTKQVPALSQAGFTALWLPPACKAFGSRSMGYDPYDYYDLGEFDQKGRKETWFGSKQDLMALIGAAHGNGLQVYADLVLNHNSGADAKETNPIDGQERWTRFTPMSRRFERDWACFHPCEYESYDGGAWGAMPDLCHRNPYVYGELLKVARWLVEEVGFDGFRYDMVKGYGEWVVSAIQEFRYRRTGPDYFKPFGVGEFWDSECQIAQWLDSTNAYSDNPVSAFDFALRWRLKDLCDTYGYSLRNLAAPGALFVDRPLQAVTFVENHDLTPPHENPQPVVNDKMMAYAFILTHPGYPCVFWQDYFGHDLGQAGSRSGIAALVEAHEKYAAGDFEVLHVDDALYMMQRTGSGSQPGLVFVLNNTGSAWNGTRVKTRWANRHFVPVAWRGRDDAGVPLDEWTDGDGWSDFWAPPRGYTVYAPKT
jgi:alpha-amylase